MQSRSFIVGTLAMALIVAANGVDARTIQRKVVRPKDVAPGADMQFTFHVGNCLNNMTFVGCK